MIHYKKDGDRYLRYSSVTDFHTNFLASMKALNVSEDYENFFNTSCSHNERPSPWRGGRFLEETLDDIKFGSKQKIDNVMQDTEEFLNSFVKKEQFFMDEQGFAYDMGALIEGEPECCVNQKELEPSKEITVLFDIAASGGTDAHQISMQCLSIIKFCYTLLENNYIVNLKFVEFTENIMNDYKHKVERIMLTIDIDLSYSPLSTIASLACTDFFRNVLFLHTAMVCQDRSIDGSSRSSRFGDINEQLKKLGYDLKEEEIFIIDSFYTNWELNDYEDQKDFDKHLLRRFERWKENMEESEHETSSLYEY